MSNDIMTDPRATAAADRFDAWLRRYRIAYALDSVLGPCALDPCRTWQHTCTVAVALRAAIAMAPLDACMAIVSTMVPPDPYATMQRHSLVGAAWQMAYRRLPLWMVQPTVHPSWMAPRLRYRYSYDTRLLLSALQDVHDLPEDTPCHLLTAITASDEKGWMHRHHITIMPAGIRLQVTTAEDDLPSAALTAAMMTETLSLDDINIVDL